MTSCASITDGSVWLERIGLGDGDGNLSFNKMVTLVLINVFAICALRQIPVAWELLSFGVMLQAAGFGIKGFMAFLATRKEMYTATTDTKITGDLAKVIAAMKAPAGERDTVLGIQPSGRVPQVFDD